MINFALLVRTAGKLLLLAAAVRLVWSVWRPARSSGRRQVVWLFCFILAYAGFIALVAGLGAKVLDHLSPDAFGVAVVALALPMVIAFLELGMRRLDGPFPELPRAVKPINIHRRRLYPWTVGAAALVLILAGALRIAPASWHDNLFVATLVGGLFACMVLWFQYYKARRYDYGRTALQGSYWIHWVYTAGELEAWKGLAPGVAGESWMGPEGLLFAGEYAPWALYTCHLVRAEVHTDFPPRLDFTFQNVSIANYSNEVILHVPIQEGHSTDLQELERRLSALCPRAQIHLTAQP